MRIVTATIYTFPCEIYQVTEIPLRENDLDSVVSHRLSQIMNNFMSANVAAAV